MMTRVEVRSATDNSDASVSFACLFENSDAGVVYRKS